MNKISHWLCLIILFVCCSAKGQTFVDPNNLQLSFTVKIGLKSSINTFNISYKSRTLYQGLFGFGWCSDLESRLVIELDGTLTLNICGDGENTSFLGTKPVEWDHSKVAETVVRRAAGKTFTGGPSIGTIALDQRDSVVESLKNGVSSRDLLEQVDRVRPPPAAGRFTADRAHATFDGKEFVVVYDTGSTYRFDRQGQLLEQRSEGGRKLKVLDRRKNELAIEVDGVAARLRLDSGGQVESIVAGNQTIGRFKYQEQSTQMKKQNGPKSLTEISLPAIKWRLKYSKYMNLEEIWRNEQIIQRMSYNDESDWIVTHTLITEGCFRRYEAGNAVDIAQSPLVSLLADLRAARSLPEAISLYMVSIFERCGTSKEALVSAQAFANASNLDNDFYLAASATWTRQNGLSFTRFNRAGDLVYVIQPPVPVNSAVDRVLGTFSNALMSLRYREPSDCEREVEVEGVLARSGHRAAQTFRLRMARTESEGSCLVVRLDWRSENGAILLNVRRSSEGRSVAVVIENGASLTLGTTKALNPCGIIDTGTAKDEAEWIKAVEKIRTVGCKGQDTVLFDAALVASSLLSINTCGCLIQPPHRHLMVDFADRILRGDYERLH